MSGERRRKLFESFIRSQKQFLSQNRTGENMAQFSAGSINKAVLSFRMRLREYVNAGGEQFGRLL